MSKSLPSSFSGAYLRPRLFVFSALISVLASSAGAQTSTLKSIGMVVPSVVQRSTLVGPISPSMNLNVNVSLKLPNPAALKAFVDSVSQPTSPSYRHFITPAQFGQQFGQPTAVVSAIVSYLKAQGLTINLVAQNNLNIMASGTAKQVQAAFHTTINSYHATNPKELGRANYYSFSSPVQFPVAYVSRVLNVAGLQNFTIPKPATTLTPALVHTLYDTVPMYSSGNQGQQRTVAICNFDGFGLTNVPLYYSAFGLPTPAGGVGSNITVIPIDGGSQNDPPAGEGDLDIQMVLAQAPLCNLIIYDGVNSLEDVLTKEADDNLADVITMSYGWLFQGDLSDASASNQLFQQLNAQGETFMHSTGDHGTTLLDAGIYPDEDPEPLGVGGSAAQTDANGNRTSEVAWGNGQNSDGEGGGGGGWGTDTFPFNVLPSWQVATGVPTNINFRLQPDVSLQSAGDQQGQTGAFFIFVSGQETEEDGTSCATPSFTGGLAVVEQWLIANGWGGNGTVVNRFGRIQDLLYTQNLQSNAWFDITTGDIGQLPNGNEATAAPGWDFATGLGAIDFNGFALTQAGSGGGNTQIGSGTASVFSDPNNGTLGQNSSGSNTNLTGNNGLSFNVQSVASAFGPAVGVQLVWDIPSGTVFSLTATLGASAAQGTTIFVYALDSNNQYDLVSTQPLNGQTSTFTIKNLKNYVVNGTVTLVARALIPSRFNVNQFTLNISQATLAGSIKATAPAHK